MCLRPRAMTWARRHLQQQSLKAETCRSKLPLRTESSRSNRERRTGQRWSVTELMLKITDIRVATVPLRSEIRNASIDFSQMTAAVVAIVTNVVRDGAPVVGYGFNSNGRYAPTGLLRERFVPRVLAAEPRELLDETGDNFDPACVWDVML